MRGGRGSSADRKTKGSSTWPGIVPARHTLSRPGDAAQFAIAGAARFDPPPNSPDGRALEIGLCSPLERDLALSGDPVSTHGPTPSDRLTNPERSAMIVGRRSQSPDLM